MKLLFFLFLSFVFTLTDSKIEAQGTAAPETNAAPALVVLTPVATRYDAAMALYNGGKYVEAIPLLSDFIRDFPESNRREEILYRLGESYRALGRFPDALAAYAFQIQAYPTGPFRINAELRRGQIQFDAQHYGDAEPALETVVAKGQGELQQVGQYLLARCLLAANPLPPEAEKRARDLLSGLLTPQPAGPLAASAALVLAELEDHEYHYSEALALWQKALSLTTDSTLQATAAARGGWSALQNKQLDVAEALFLQARKLDPSGDARKIANTGLLRILNQQKRWAEWLSVYQREAPLFLENAQQEIDYDRAQAFSALKQWSEALAALEVYGKNYPGAANTAVLAYQHFLARSHLDHDAILGEGDAFLRNWPDSAYGVEVKLLQAQELSRRHQFADALPLWKNLAELAVRPTGKELPHRAILLEVARACDALVKWPEAATAYQAYLDDLATSLNLNKEEKAQELKARIRLALSFQNSDQLLAAETAWKEVQASASPNSPEQQLALESLGLIYTKAGPSRQGEAVAVFQDILAHYPQSPLRALAAYTVGDSLFQHQKYSEAEKWLLISRQTDPAAWQQPATQRLVLGAYAAKEAAKTAAYFHDYEALAPPTNPQAQIAARLPAAVPYWLAEQAQAVGQTQQAEIYYRRVTQDPNPGELLSSAWWQLGEVQSAEQKWSAAVASYQAFRRLKPEDKDATRVILALCRAELRAGAAADAKPLAEQALLQEPEGPNSAQARELLGEIALAQKNYAEAARQFATLSVLFDNPKIAPAAMAQAASAYEQAGDPKAAAAWRQKLKDKYPSTPP